MELVVKSLTPLCSWMKLKLTCCRPRLMYKNGVRTRIHTIGPYSSNFLCICITHWVCLHDDKRIPFWCRNDFCPRCAYIYRANRFMQMSRSNPFTWIRLDICFSTELVLFYDAQVYTILKPPQLNTALCPCALTKLSISLQHCSLIVLQTFLLFTRA